MSEGDPFPGVPVPCTTGDQRIPWCGDMPRLNLWGLNEEFPELPDPWFSGPSEDGTVYALRGGM